MHVICYQVDVSLLVSVWFSFFISLKFFFLLETSSPGNQLPSHHAGQAAAIFLKTVLIFPRTPNRDSPQDGLGRLESLPVWWDALVAVKAPLPQWRFLIVGHSLVFVFFLSSN